MRVRRVEDDEGFRFDQAVFIGLTDHGGFEHGGVGGQRRFDFEGGNPDAADFEHVVGAAAIGEIAVVALAVLVAASGPGAEKGVAALFTVVPVIRGAGRAVDVQLAEFAFWHRLAVFIEQADFIARHRLAGSAVADGAGPVR